MTDQEKLEAVQRWHAAVREATEGLLSDEVGGVVALRIFFAVKHGEHDHSAGNVGMTVQGEEFAGGMLVKSAMMLMLDPDGNREVKLIEAAPKS